MCGLKVLLMVMFQFCWCSVLVMLVVDSGSMFLSGFESAEIVFAVELWGLLGVSELFS